MVCESVSESGLRFNEADPQDDQPKKLIEVDIDSPRWTESN